MSRYDPVAISILAAVARTGSVTAAAAELDLSQPTAGRRLRALEEAVGAPLVARHGRGVTLTDAGGELLHAAQDVVAALDRFELLARARGRAVGGVVRVSASEAVATELLPWWAAELRRDHPGIQLALVAENRVTDVSHREADVAIRMFRPKAPDVVAVRIGPTPMALYATRDYVARRGAPRTREDARAHDIVGYDRDPVLVRAFREVIGDLPPERIVLRTDGHGAALAAVRAGVGIGAAQRVIAARYPDLVEVGQEIPVPALEMWLVTHRDLRRSRLVRTVYDSLRSWLLADLARHAAAVGSSRP